MITISDILLPEHIDLDVKPDGQEEIIYNVALQLRQDDRVKDWQAFYDGLQAKESWMLDEKEYKICIPHTRTDSVKTMVMSVGRTVLSGETPEPGGRPVVQYTFVIGIPFALASDYLRIIGAFARIFKDKAVEAGLRTVCKPEEFLALLVQKEMKL